MCNRMQFDKHTSTVMCTRCGYVGESIILSVGMLRNMRPQARFSEYCNPVPPGAIKDPILPMKEPSKNTLTESSHFAGFEREEYDPHTHACPQCKNTEHVTLVLEPSYHKGERVWELKQMFEFGYVPIRKWRKYIWRGFWRKLDSIVETVENKKELMWVLRHLAIKHMHKLERHPLTMRSIPSKEAVQRVTAMLGKDTLKMAAMFKVCARREESVRRLVSQWNTKIPLDDLGPRGITWLTALCQRLMVDSTKLFIRANVRDMLNKHPLVSVHQGHAPSKDVTTQWAIKPEDRDWFARCGLVSSAGDTTHKKYGELEWHPSISMDRGLLVNDDEGITWWYDPTEGRHVAVGRDLRQVSYNDAIGDDEDDDDIPLPPTPEELKVSGSAPVELDAINDEVYLENKRLSLLGRHKEILNNVMKQEMLRAAN